MKMIILFTVMLFLLVLSSFRAQQSADGKKIYDAKCARCHGVDGTRHFLGAKNLQKSSLSDSAMVKIIFKGRKIMPSFRSTLSGEEIDAVVNYVKMLGK